ncbi:MAG: hypothetical protein ABF311_05765 [Polaribacter sp.]
MLLTNLTAEQQSVLKVIQLDHLTSTQILKKVDNVSMILSLYTILDELKMKGYVKSYRKQNLKFHYAT